MFPWPNLRLAATRLFWNNGAAPLVVKQAEHMLRIGGRKKVLGLSFLSSSQYFQCQVGSDFFERILLLPQKKEEDGMRWHFIKILLLPDFFERKDKPGFFFFFNAKKWFLFDSALKSKHFSTAALLFYPPVGLRTIRCKNFNWISWTGIVIIITQWHLLCKDK